MYCAPNFKVLPRHCILTNGIHSNESPESIGFILSSSSKFEIFSSGQGRRKQVQIGWIRPKGILIKVQKLVFQATSRAHQKEGEQLHTQLLCPCK